MTAPPHMYTSIIARHKLIGILTGFASSMYAGDEVDDKDSEHGWKCRLPLPAVARKLW
ncbi:hypothetical protein PUN28_005246 [Cardiocondyla obscurior]|uniref:Uncharacterized protein n=1 Tax=Cardiocondyla obscurior TaxID=286306 RepID=A0AAW2GJT9_9HYME